ncbi:MAG: hypothetical protein ACHREM_09160 [Polyangiales bacterium]
MNHEKIRKLLLEMADAEEPTVYAARPPSLRRKVVEPPAPTNTDDARAVALLKKLGREAP